MPSWGEGLSGRRNGEGPRGDTKELFVRNLGAGGVNREIARREPPINGDLVMVLPEAHARRRFPEDHAD